MSEYQRTEDGAGVRWQWVDEERCMVIDSLTGEPERFTADNGSIGTLREALHYVKERQGWEDRMVIVRLPCVVAYRL